MKELSGKDSTSSFAPDLVVHCSTQQSSLLVFGRETPSAERISTTLRFGASLEAPFLCTGDNLQSLGLYFECDPNLRSTLIRIDLHEGLSRKGRKVRGATIRTDDLLEDQPSFIEFPPIPKSQNRWFTARVSVGNPLFKKGLKLIGRAARPEDKENSQLTFLELLRGAVSVKRGPFAPIPVPNYVATYRHSELNLSFAGWESSESERTPLELHPVAPLQFTFLGEFDNLVELRFKLCTWGKEAKTGMRVDVYAVDENDRPLLCRYQAPEQELLDNADLIVSLPDNLPAAGRWIEVECFKEVSESDSPLGIWGTLIPRHHKVLDSLEHSKDERLTSYVNKKETSLAQVRSATEPQEEVFLPHCFGLCGSNPLQLEYFGFSGRSLDKSYLRLNPDHPLTFRVSTPASSFCEISFWFVTWGETRYGKITLEIADDQEILRSLDLAVEQISDNAFQSFKFEPIEDSKDRNLQVRLFSPEASLDNPIGVSGAVLKKRSLYWERLQRQSDKGHWSAVEHTKPAVDLELALELPLSNNPAPGKVVLVLDSSTKPGCASAALKDVRSTLEREGVDFRVRSFDELRHHLHRDNFFLRDYAPWEALSSDLYRDLPDLRCALLPPTEVNGDLRAFLALAHSFGRPVFRIDPNGTLGGAELSLRTIENACAEYTAQRFPTISVVAALVPELEINQAFVTSLLSQTYKGTYELVLIVPENTNWTPEDLGWPSDESRVDLRLTSVPDTTPIHERINHGVEHAARDILLIVNPDCEIASTLIEGHQQEHSTGEFDVVLGNHQVKSKGETLKASLDETNPRGFSNLNPNNFSLHRRFLGPALYLSDPIENEASNLNWLALKLGHRLFSEGARFGFAEAARTVALASDESADRTRLAEAATRKPSLLLTARRALSARPARARKLRVLTYRWHCGHQYELYKLGHAFSLVSLPKEYAFNRWNLSTRWEYEQRPFPNNASFLSLEQVCERDFDLMILHFDEAVLAPENSGGRLPYDWGEPFRVLRERCGLPAIAICHGTPQFKNQYVVSDEDVGFGDVSGYERERLVDLLSDTLVVCNSHQAQKEWQFNRSSVIWHGFDPSEWPLGERERGVLSLGGPMRERPYYRGYHLFKDVVSKLPTQHRPEVLKVPLPPAWMRHNTNRYAYAKFQRFVRELGSYSVYFNPTLRSPMPRSRGEAMMCGLACVTTTHHDATRFIENGVNGFCSDDPNELAEALLELSQNPLRARRIGENGRETAQDLFNLDRYLNSWDEILSEVLP